MEGSEKSLTFVYILIISTLCFIIVMYLKRKQPSTGESIQDRIWRKIAFAYQDMLHTLDDAEKELLKHTYHNTIFNCKGVKVSNDTRKTSKKKGSNVHNEQMMLPLLTRDMNRTFLFTKKASPYCQRLKEVGRRHSMLYSTDERFTQNIMLCQGATLKMDLKSRTAKPKQRNYKKINRTTNVERAINVDISPWENFSP
ncbi:unnamed protein product [Paramecium octaurelia]|uniref:Uncharacterized protein n=1 Tax=Paramecium octaurelia TaxID=43137 RepID=A0A8S1TB26_PAROT|nr:unnamed protein product [Paramecium octaurelia]